MVNKNYFWILKKGAKFIQNFKFDICQKFVYTYFKFIIVTIYFLKRLYKKQINVPFNFYLFIYLLKFKKSKSFILDLIYLLKFKKLKSFVLDLILSFWIGQEPPMDIRYRIMLRNTSSASLCLSVSSRLNWRSNHSFTCNANYFANRQNEVL